MKPYLDSSDAAEEAAEILDEAQYTSNIASADIPQEVLNELISGDEVVVLPKIGSLSSNPVYPFCERAFDLGACSLALLVLVIPPGACGDESEIGLSRPIIYTQRRVGKDGRVFEMY
ncbi:MAG: hypothetical protein RR547_10360, partial [Raoultibacter sp.]